jgi:organic radical activating enzyme
MYIQLTTRCNMTCEHCCFACTSKGVDLPKELAFRAIDQAAENCDSITIGGGEPTLHPDFWEILAYAIEQGENVAESWVSIITNGKRTEDALALAFLADHCLLSAELSQDSYHDPVNPLVVETFKDHSRIAWQGRQYLPKCVAEAVGYCEYDEISYREQMWQEDLEERREQGEDVDAEEEAGFEMDEDEALENFWECYENHDASKYYSGYNKRPTLKGIRTVKKIMERGRGKNIAGAVDECGCDTVFVGAEGKVWYCGCKDYAIAEEFPADIYAAYSDIRDRFAAETGDDEPDCSKTAAFHAFAKYGIKAGDTIAIRGDLSTHKYKPEQLVDGKYLRHTGHGGVWTTTVKEAVFNGEWVAVEGGGAWATDLCEVYEPELVPA